MCLCNSAASSAFPFLRVFNQLDASGKRAALKNPCLVMEGALGELGGHVHVSPGADLLGCTPGTCV